MHTQEIDAYNFRVVAKFKGFLSNTSYLDMGMEASLMERGCNSTDVSIE